MTNATNQPKGKTMSEQIKRADFETHEDWAAAVADARDQRNFGRRDRTARLIKENADAPADQLIRAIFATCSSIRDRDEVGNHPEGELLELNEALELWYAVDELRLGFILPNKDRHNLDEPSWVFLIHQGNMAHPHIEDIVDIGSAMDTVPELAKAIDQDN